MKIHYDGESAKVIHGDCMEVMPLGTADSVDAIVTDPPYGLGFMGKKWDTLPPGKEWAELCLRVLKPGGYLLAFGGTRTWHRLAVAVEDAGFEMRDNIAWLYGTGFPKSKGQLKPAFEPIILARKPGKNGMLNVDACRIGDGSDVPAFENPGRASRHGIYGDGLNGSKRTGETATVGRWPANVVLDESQVITLDQRPGEVSRFFYCAKASQAERPVVDEVAHLTVKPLALMRWLVRLVAPSGGRVLDPFLGSGTTLEACLLEGFYCVGIENEAAYLPLVDVRLARNIKQIA